jgi:hypothetical protein
MQNINYLALLQQQIGSSKWDQWTALRWQFYDYATYPAAGCTQLQFFIQPVGGTDPVSTLVKTTEDTNCPKQRSLGQVFFVMQNIRTHICIAPKNRQAAAIANNATLLYGNNGVNKAFSKIYEIMRRGVLNIRIGQKAYFDIPYPLCNAPAGFGLDITQHAAVYSASASAGLWVQSDPDRANVYDVAPPQMIEPEQTFDVTLDYPTTSPVLTSLVNSADLLVRVGVIFDGYLARPSQ